MYLEAKETARLYKVLTEKLGSETTEAMFKYIDNKAERAVEATINTLATKEDIGSVRTELVDFKLATKEDIGSVRKELIDFKLATKGEFGSVRKELVDFKLAIKDDIAGVRKEIFVTREDMAALKYELSNKIANSVRWSFLFWIGQAATTIGIMFLIMKK